MFAELRARLAARVVGHEAVRDRLALLCVQHMLGTSTSPLRALLIGPSGAGKTTILRAICDSLPVAHAFLDATDFSASGWAGTNVSDVLAALWQQAGESTAAMSRAVVVIDEMDKLRARGSGAGAEVARDRQRSLLPVLGANPIRFTGSTSKDRTLIWDSRRALIVMAGVFNGLPRDREILPHDLVRAGFLPELVERMGQILPLGPLRPADAARVLRSRVRDDIALFASFGYKLLVTDEACGLVARAMADGALRIGMRQAATLLSAVAQGKLLGLLRARAPSGTVVVLTPDDVDLPL